jgi:hypothetical protein
MLICMYGHRNEAALKGDSDYGESCIACGSTLASKITWAYKNEWRLYASLGQCLSENIWHVAKLLIRNWKLLTKGLTKGQNSGYPGCGHGSSETQEGSSVLSLWNLIPECTRNLSPLALQSLSSNLIAHPLAKQLWRRRVGFKVGRNVQDYVLLGPCRMWLKVL